MARQTTSTKATITQRQLSALRGAVRVAADTNPMGADKGQRCREIAGAVCARYGTRTLAELAESDLSEALAFVAGMGKPAPQYGPVENLLRTGKTALTDTIASIRQACRDVTAYRHVVEGALLAPFKTALNVDGKGNLEANTQEALGYMLGMPLLDAEAALDRAASVLEVVSTHLPHAGKALDMLSASTTPDDPFPNMGAD